MATGLGVARPRSIPKRAADALKTQPFKAGASATCFAAG
eukprot:CAMPEP_0204262164 /NCGR_PEP_ID=MMETSP0468-20130131/7484_1 /ASSEMBLY_ACC=CAM_ASM_000383 /TAXON_ID=2969 /ORGANISM="Oxyrrhis marina" /LENGTH=38 /DNA_ID= /DNA_START= /DNA_END= /DNA_ORIENTATION=